MTTETIAVAANDVATSNKKPAKAKSLPKASNSAQARRSTGGYVRTARPPVARPPVARGGR